MPSDVTHLSLPTDLTAMRAARAAVQELLADAPVRFVSDALLATSEIVSNAVLHVGGPVEFDARFDGETFELAVADMSSAPPVVPVEASPWSTGGRGLAILDRVADSWGAVDDGPGKVVWCRMSLRRSAR